MNTIAEPNGSTTATQEQTEAVQNYVSPDVNIFEDQDGYVLEAEMPGVAKDGVDISVEETILTLTGRRQNTEPNAEELHRESSPLDYRRVFELDPAIDTARITAKIEQGVLTVTLPKSERAKPRKVTVNE